MTTISSGTTSTAATTASTTSTASTASTSSGTTATSSTGAITISGVGSGIDTASIVTALVNAEKAPKQSQIDKQSLVANTSLTAIGQLTSALDTYRTAIKDLSSSGTTGFTGLSASSSSESTATATVDSTASTGTYTLVVANLATASKITSANFAGKAATVVNTGTTPADFTITQSGTSTKVSIAAGATLSQMRDSINTAMASQGISANILTDANGSRLVLSSTTTGAGSGITTSAGAGLEAFQDKTTATLDTDGNPVVPAASTTTSAFTGNTPINAKYTIDGVSMESSLNTVAAAISGVSMKLTGVGTTTVTVGTDTTAMKAKVSTFVDAYNALMTTMNTLTKVSVSDSGATSGGGLTGDATVRHMVSAIRNELVTSSTSGITLGSIGVATDGNTGLLALNDTKWNSAVATSSNITAIQKLFTGTTGLLARMTSATATYAGSSGVLATRTTNLNTTISNLADQQTKLDTRIATLQATLSAKYTAMDTLVAQLTATSKSVMTTLNSLNDSSSDS